MRIFVCTKKKYSLVSKIFEKINKKQKKCNFMPQRLPYQENVIFPKMAQIVAKIVPSMVKCCEKMI